MKAEDNYVVLSFHYNFLDMISMRLYCFILLRMLGNFAMIKHLPVTALTFYPFVVSPEADHVVKNHC